MAIGLSVGNDQNQVPPLPPPTDVSLEFVHGDLFVKWEKPPEYHHPCLYQVNVYQNENVRLQVVIEQTELKVPKGQCDPMAHYKATVSTQKTDGTNVKSEPVATATKMRCKKLSETVYIDDSSPLREGYDVYIGYMKGAGNVHDKVAVKLVDGDFSREVTNLLQLSSMENVVSYKASGDIKGIGQRAFIVTELCHEYNLYDMAEKGLLKDMPSEVKKILVHIMRGLSHIHSANILHRDLKLQNVLRSLDKKSMKICDFGLSKQLRNDKSKVSKSAMAIGTEGWGSPEHYAANTDMSRKSDIFSAGLIFCYILSNGKHACGVDPHRWKLHIMDKNTISLPDFKCDEPLLAADLVNKMLQYNPDDRPLSKEVLAHPFFWSSERKLELINHACHYIQGMRRHESPPIIALHILGDLQSMGNDFCDWGEKIFRNAGYGGYLSQMARGETPRSVILNLKLLIDLIRFIRNVAEHHTENSELTPLFKKEQAAVWNYFSGIFPALLPGLFNIFSKLFPGMEVIFGLNNVREVLKRRVEYAPLELP